MSRKFAPMLLVAILLISLFAGCKKEPETIKIGLEVPLTGDYAYEGQGMEKAVRLLVDQVNEEGGLLGRQVELIVEDDAGDPTQAALVAQRLVDAGVVAVIGAYNSTATEPASEIYNEAGILHITPSSTATRLTEKGFQRFFRVCFLDDRQGLFAAKFMKEVLGAQNIAVLHDNSTYAQGLAEHTKRYAEEMGLNVVFFDAINPDDTDFTPILTNLAGAEPDAVYFTGYHPQGGLLLKQSGELGLDLTWVMGNACNNPELIQIAGLENAVGTYVTTEPLPKDLDYPEAKEYVAAFEAKYGEPVASVWWLMAAEAFNVIRYAIEQTESTDPAVLAEFLHNEAKDIPGLTGPILGWDEKGDRLGTIHVAYIIDENGNFVLNPEQPSP
ncbi:MAG TPA: branched-chain amino acid ABC transporter substrate-binding protein [Anaerolineae bacterium]|nr:branched-chain amino acid ABC transporter substrate-binding protein [Anaerolineae bacterium]